MSQSIFIDNGDIDKRTIGSNATAFAFLTNIPITKGHTLIAPKRVVKTVNELSDDEITDMRRLLIAVKQVLVDHYNAEGFNFAWNEGSEYGQSVPHFHLHVVPRTKNDNGISDYDPRKLLYRPGTRPASSESELASFARQISDKINL